MIFNPLVVVVVIGDYKDSPLPSIEGALNDYHNVVRAFNYIRRYDIVFATNNGVKHLANKNCVTNINEIKSFDFKLKWVDNDLDNFNTHISQEILSSQNGDANNYDSLIYILSSHGDSDESVYDSNGEELSIEYIHYTFNNKSCKSLRQRPKIYIFDIDRVGGDSYTAKQASQMHMLQSDNNINYNQNSNNLKSKDGEHVHVHSPNMTPSLPEAVLDTKTYTEKSHCCTIFGNSKQQPWSIGTKNEFKGSLFVSSFTKAVSSNFTFDNSSFSDVLFETRQNMVNTLSLGKNRVRLDEIVLNERSTMPYDIRFASGGIIEANSKDDHDQDVKINVCCFIL